MPANTGVHWRLESSIISRRVYIQTHRQKEQKQKHHSLQVPPKPHKQHLSQMNKFTCTGGSPHFGDRFESW